MQPMIVAQKRNLLLQILQNEENECSESDRVFYSSLIDWYDEKGFWTIKQEAAVDRARATHAKHSVESFNETQIEKPSELFFDGKKIRQLLDSAATKIKYPSIHFWRDIGEIQFYLCGNLSKTPGFIRITNSQKYPNQEIYGEINKDGKGLFRRDTSANFKKEILSILENPIEESKVRGIRSGFCCYCGKGIQTKESLAVGYGPICAANFGLPWGESTPPSEEELVKI